MTTVRKITAASALVIAAAGMTIPTVSAATPAAQLREVCVKSSYVKRSPGVIPVGTVYRGQKVQVTRYTSTHRYARIVAPLPGFTVRGWVPTANLCKKGETADFAKTERYRLKIANSPAGGDPGFLYVGGPANVTVMDAERAGQDVAVCITPAPIDQPSCRTTRTDQARGFAWSAAVSTDVRVTVEDGTVLSTTVFPFETSDTKGSH